jgi:hypothetical protein
MRARQMLVLLTIPLFLCVRVEAEVLTVDLTGGADHTEIQPAIDAAMDGDTVLVKPGNYVISAPVSFLGKAIAIRGESGPEFTMIQMASDPPDPAPGAVVVFENGEGETAILEGFTLCGSHYGGVYCEGNSSPTLTNLISAAIARRPEL